MVAVHSTATAIGPLVEDHCHKLEQVAVIVLSSLVDIHHLLAGCINLHLNYQSLDLIGIDLPD